MTAVPVRPTPRWAHARKSLRQPAFWVVAGLLVIGGWRTGVILQAAFATYPNATLVAVGLFALYAVPFWIFVENLDYIEREPRLLLLTAFGWGGLVATTTAIPGSAAVHNLLAKTASPQFAAAWGPAIAGPTIEEILKTLGIVAIVLIARAQINSVLDGMVYGALVGLGFQVVENVVYAVNAVVLAGSGDDVEPVIATFFLRGFVGGLWSHTLFSALAGAGVAHLVVRTDRPLWTRVPVATTGLFAAWLCHFVWNSPLLADGFGYGGLGVFAALLIKGVPPLMLGLWMVRNARDREAHYYVAQLEALGDPAVATPGELETLGSGRRRAQAQRHAYRNRGVRARAAVRRLQRAQARLAVELSRDGVGSSVQRRQDVLAVRHRLEALGHPEGAVPHRLPSWRRWLGGLSPDGAPARDRY